MWILMALVLQNPNPAAHPYLQQGMVLSEFSSLQACMETGAQMT